MTQVDVLHSLESIFILLLGFVLWVGGGGLGDLLGLTQSGLLLVDQQINDQKSVVSFFLLLLARTQSSPVLSGLCCNARRGKNARGA